MCGQTPVDATAATDLQSKNGEVRRTGSAGEPRQQSDEEHSLRDHGAGCERRRALDDAWHCCSVGWDPCDVTPLENSNSEAYTTNGSDFGFFLPRRIAVGRIAYAYMLHLVGQVRRCSRNSYSHWY
eukprot:2695970-Rhodomonas_salina.2